MRLVCLIQGTQKLKRRRRKIKEMNIGTNPSRTGGLWEKSWDFCSLNQKYDTNHNFLFFFLVILRKISVYLAENKQKTPQSSTPRSTAFKKSDRSTKENKIPQTYHIHKDGKKLAFLSLTSSGNLPQAATQVWKCNFTAIVVVEFLLTRIFIIKITLQPCSNF